MMRTIAALLTWLALTSAALAQRVVPPETTINCAFNTTPPVVATGNMIRVQCDSQGRLIMTTASGGGETVDQGAPATTANSWPVKITDGVNGPVQVLTTFADGVVTGPKLGVWNQNYLYNGTSSSIWRDLVSPLNTGFGTAAVGIVSSSSAGSAITSVVTGAAANNLILKASAGNLYSAYATNLTATAGFLVILNAVAAPADGAITPLECVPLPGNGNASINYNPGPTARFSTGITAVVTSAATCFTKTTGVITAFIRGSTQ